MKLNLVFLLGVFSGQRQHQEGGAGRGALVCRRGDQPSVQTEDPGLCIWGREGAALDWQHQDAPPLRGEDGRGRVPLHGDGAVPRGLDGLRSSLQRLPAVVQGGAAAGDQPLPGGHGLSASPGLPRWLGEES